MFHSPNRPFILHFDGYNINLHFKSFSSGTNCNFISCFYCTEWMEWMSHKKHKETKQQPGTAGPGNILGCCLVFFRFLCNIHSIHPVLEIRASKVPHPVFLMAGLNEPAMSSCEGPWLLRSGLMRRGGRSGTD